MRVGISGRLTQIFIQSKLTPLLLIASIGLGALALISLPREEEPQISVPMVDIMVSANGYKAPSAVELITRPLEDIVKGIDGVEHVYSQTEDDQALTTARFYAGTDQDTAILRVHEKIRANIRDLPQGIPEPLIVGRGINDVAILTLTLAPKKEAASRWDHNALYRLGLELQHELAKTENVGLNYIVGGERSELRIEPDPEKLALYGVTLNQLVDKLKNANRSFQSGGFDQHNVHRPIVLGQTLQGVTDIGLLLITTRDGRPVYVKDVAHMTLGGAQDQARVWMIEKADGALARRPAVTLAFAKRKNTNAVSVASDLLKRLDLLKGRVLPSDIEVTVTRNYGETATEKADELIFHLLLATISIVLLISWTIGWREGVVVLVAIPTTILLTLFSSWLMGYTINRVSLFALIFSIGILVDDAIVIVENIVRRWHTDKGADLVETAVDAVSEVGNPTIVATLTIMAALLPMMFVTGLMGPYMSPIPANASMAMLFSFFVAEIITPWLLLKISGRYFADGGDGKTGEHKQGRLEQLFERLARPVLANKKVARRFILSISFVTLLSVLFVPAGLVRVKLLPFDNKSEMQVVVDLPKGTTLEGTERFLQEVAGKIESLPELETIQIYAGTAAPFNFNGLVRHAFLRSAPEQGEVQINIVPKDRRHRTSHEIALDVRTRLLHMDVPVGGVLKVVEVPPGPPVLATLMAEIYGPNASARFQAAENVRAAFHSVPSITDIDTSYDKRGKRLRFSIHQENLEYFGVEEQAVWDTLAAVTGGVKIGYAQRGQGVRPIDIAVRIPRESQWLGERILSTPVPAGGTNRQGKNVELGDVVNVSYEESSAPIYRRDGHYAETVTGELAGKYEAPIYGMFAVEKALKEKGVDLSVLYHGQPIDESYTTLLWDGEWEVTFVTFRDMGAAFIVALLVIYLLVVGLFKSFLIPLVILVPVPLTLIGIMIGHALLGAPFSAPSMIGFIALAGIIVRNSILLVDFIKHLRAGGLPLHEALLEAGRIRLRPIALTAAAAMIGAAFILFDPIFQGLAISLVFGLASATVLTMLVIPALYVWLRD